MDYEKNWVRDVTDPFGFEVHKDCLSCRLYKNGCTRVTIHKFGGACVMDDVKKMFPESEDEDMSGVVG